MPHLTRIEAIEHLGMNSKHFDNFFKCANEFSPLPRRRGQRYYFDSVELDRWRENYESRLFYLTAEEYNRCLDFALAIHYRGYARIDWGSARQREFGQKVSNWVKGQLGELAVAHYCHDRLGIDIELDFDMHDTIVPQDVAAVIRNGVRREPQHRIGIKASKLKNAFLVLSRNEVELENRTSDVYVFTRVGLPDDHLLRITRNEIIDRVRNQQHYPLYQDQIPNFEPIVCEVAGFAYRDELELVGSIPGQNFEGERYVKKTGDLRRTIDDWQELFS